jgi:AcrR family transcriptional regulator
LIRAGFELLGGEGAAATTVRAVCRRAELNARYFYESFEDLDELLVAVYDNVVEALATEIVDGQAAAPDEPRAQLRVAIERSVKFVDEDRRRGRVLYVEALGNEALNRRRREAGLALVELIEQAAGGSDDSTPATDGVTRLAAAILVAGFSELLSEWLEHRIDLSAEQLGDDATDLFIRLGEASAEIASRRQRHQRRTSSRRRR